MFKIKAYVFFIIMSSISAHAGSGTATINGNISDSSAAVNNHQVILYRVVGGYVEATQTDINGDYSFTELDAGGYYVTTGTALDDYVDYVWQDAANGGPQICSPCYFPAMSHISLADAMIKNNVNFIIQIGGVISGTLTDSTSMDAVSSLLIRARKATYTYNAYANPDPLTGNYSIKGVPDGDYKVYLQEGVENQHIPQIFGGPECNTCYRLAYNDNGIGTILSISTANTINNIDFSLNVGASISGKVVDAITENALQERAVVLVFDELNDLITSVPLFGTNYDPAADGSFTVGGLLPGSYYIQGGDQGQEFYQRELFANKPCYFSGCDRGTGDAVVLSAQENITGVDFLLEKGGKISGSITDETSGLPLALAINQRLQVEFYDINEKVIGAAIVQEDGTYTSNRAMAPGQYAARTGSMFVGDLTQPYINEKYNDIPCAGIACDLSTQDITVTAETTTADIDFALSTGFSFSGTITDTTTGNPIPNVHVLVYKDMGIGNELKFANWATTSDGTNQPIGEFEVSGLPAGTYYARTNNGSNMPFFTSGWRAVPSGPWIDILHNGIPCPGSCDVSIGTPIVLGLSQRGTSININFSLNLGATIAGKVVDFTNNGPIEQIHVNVFDQQGQFLSSYETNEQGEYVTVGFEAGTYYLTTNSFDVLIDVKYGNDTCHIGNCNPLDGIPVTLTAFENKTDIDFMIKVDYLFGHSFD